ncbi:epoxide hydrolase [Chromatiales bacterium (ex Bugula neritina AB1)]|nr:epoxide hydrolase [Chromatiales bacterium (ex Bugula neritina AB1)]
MFDSNTAAQWGVEFKNIDVGAVNLQVAVAGTGPLIILVHGFPECWYSWRHQIRPLTEAGYQVAAPNVRGYGDSAKPQDIRAYDMQSLTADMAGLRMAVSPEKPAIIIGHDWGAPIAWNSALLYPQLFSAVAGLSVPHVPPGDTVAIDLFQRVFTDQGKFFYMVYFQNEGVAEAELSADPQRSIRLFFTALGGDAAAGAWPVDKPYDRSLFDQMIEPLMPRKWFTHDDLTYYAGIFEKCGFRGPLNRYRNFHRDSDFLRKQGKKIIQQPSLYVIGEHDMVAQMYPAGPAVAMQKYAGNAHRDFTLPGCGHWTQQERPQEVNKILLDWLASLPE